GAGTQAPGGAGTQAPGGAGVHVPGGAGAQASGGAGVHVPGGAGAQAPGGAGAQVDGGAGETILEGEVLAKRPGAAGRTPALPPGTHRLQDVTATLGHGAARLAVRGGRLARRHPLESIAIVLIGVGGLIFPFPFWLLGGVLAIWSRIWNVGDKWAALAGPPGFALAGTVITALILGGA